MNDRPIFALVVYFFFILVSTKLQHFKKSLVVLKNIAITLFQVSYSGALPFLALVSVLVFFFDAKLFCLPGQKTAKFNK